MSLLGEWAEAEAEDPAGGDPAAAAGPADGGEPLAELVFPDTEAFVRDYLAVTYRRPLDGGRTATWCPQWWAHPEAVLRLEALWRSWEYLRTDPALGMSVWLRDHADHHMPVLFDPAGPFKGCTPDKGHGDRLLPLPLTPAPPQPSGSPL